MKNFFCFLLLLFVSFLKGQSFELVNVPGLTDVSTDSRSANFVDVNGDYLDDIFISNGLSSGQNNMLFINNGNGDFTMAAGDDIVLDNDRSVAATFADADNDGDLDSYVVTFGGGGVGKKNYFYRNNGSGSFTYEPNIAMGIPLTYSEAAVWIDGNNDQLLDLYVTNSVGQLANLYFANLGNGNFEQVSSIDITTENLPSRSVDWIDYDGDGDSDLFVTNEGGEKNSLFRNDGPDNFTQISTSPITLDNKTSAGSSWGDIDNDGDFDLFVANYDSVGEKNQLFRNDGNSFTEITSSIIATPQTNSFGSTFGDVDNDGDLDLFVCNAYLSSQNGNFLYINDGAGNFTLDTSSDLSSFNGRTFGAAFGDYNQDGWLDIILANNKNDGEPNSLYKNVGSGKNWVKFVCVGTISNSSAVGTTVRLRSQIQGSDVWQTRKISSTSGYCSQNSYTMHFGLDDGNVIQDLEVNWPSGTIETFANVAPNTTYIITEGFGIELLSMNEVRIEQSEVKVHPNPSGDYLNIEIGNVQKFSEDARIEIIDLTGKLTRNIDKSNISFYSINKAQINISNLSNGTYLCKIFMNNYDNPIVSKFIKK